MKKMVLIENNKATPVNYKPKQIKDMINSKLYNVYELYDVLLIIKIGE